MTHPASGICGETQNRETLAKDSGRVMAKEQPKGLSQFMTGHRLEVTVVWPSWVVLLLGIWLVMSPWLLGYSDVLLARYNALIVGALIVMFGYLTSIPPDKRSEPPGQD